METLFDTVVAAEADTISLAALALMLIGGAVGLTGLAGLGIIAALPARRRAR